MLIKENGQNNEKNNKRNGNRVGRKKNVVIKLENDVETFQEYTNNDPLQLHCTFVWWTAFSLIASVLTATGFWLPFWLSGNYHDIIVSFGPFSRCNYPMIDINGKLKVIKNCFRYENFYEIPTLSGQLTTVIIGFGVILSILMSLMLLFSCCMPRALTSSNTLLLVQTQFFLGLTLITGIIIYPIGWDNELIFTICGGRRSLFELEKCQVSLSIYLLVVGIGIQFFSLIFGLITSKKLQKS